MTVDYVLRVAATCFFGLGFVLLAGLLLLLPAYGYLSARAEMATDAAPSGLAEKIRAEEASLRLAGEMLALLPPSEGKTLASSAVIARVRAAAAAAGRIELLFVGYQTSGNLSIRGKADTREALIAFGKALKADSALADISIPVELLAKSRDISFDLRGGVVF